MTHTTFSLEYPEHKVKTILVVEDDEEIGVFLIEALKIESPYHALLAINANQALEIVKTLRPDLFVLDYQLPGMNGLELAARFQQTDALKDVPVIFMSANFPKHLRSGLNSVLLEKPFSLDDLLTTIQQALGE